MLIDLLNYDQGTFILSDILYVLSMSLLDVNMPVHFLSKRL